MPERLLLVMVVAILIVVIFQDRNKIQSLEKERSACFDQKEKLAIESSQLKQQVTQMKEQQQKTDRVSRKSSAKLAALEEDLEKLEDERLAWDDEKDRLLIHEKNLKQQHDGCRSQLKAAELATSEEKIRNLKTESDVEELRKEVIACKVETFTQTLLQAAALSVTFEEEEVPTTAEEIHNQDTEDRESRTAGVEPTSGCSEYRAYPAFVKKFKTKAALKENEVINGIAILNEDIFAITLGSNVIQRFDSATLSIQETLALEDAENLLDLQPCHQSESLFVIATDSTFNGPRFISSVDPYDPKILHSWEVDSCIERLSVTEDCHVIAACADQNKIIEYSSTGYLIREILLKPKMGIVSPRLALKMTNGNFLVNYHGNFPYAGFGLAILDSNGDVLKSYSDSSQYSGFVNSMAINRQGNILVAAMFTGRVLILNSDLEYKRDLLSKEYEIGMIMAMLLDEVNGRLIVADCTFNNFIEGRYFDNADILVFDIL